MCRIAGPAARPGRARRDDRAARRPTAGAARPACAFLAYPGEEADGRAHIADAVAPRRVGGALGEAEGFAWRGEWRVPNVAVARAEAAGGRARARVLRPASRVAVGVRRHRHQRQDLCSQWIAAALDARGTRSRRDRHAGQRLSRRAEPTAQHHARCARDAATAQQFLPAGASASRWKCPRTASRRAA